MRKSIKALFMAIVLLFPCVFVFSGCNGDKKDPIAPVWLTNATATFTNTDFVPELEEVLPEAAIGKQTIKTSQAASLQSRQSSVRVAVQETADDYDSIDVSDLAFMTSNIERILDRFVIMKENAEWTKNWVIDALENSGMQNKNSWHKKGKRKSNNHVENGTDKDTVKYEETSLEDKVMYLSRETLWGNDFKELRNLRLTIFADGGTEIYEDVVCISSHYRDGKERETRSTYLTYYKDDVFIYLNSGENYFDMGGSLLHQEESCEYTTFYNYMEFKKEGDLNVGTIVSCQIGEGWSGDSCYIAYLEGDDKDMWMYENNSRANYKNTDDYSDSTLSLVKDGASLTYYEPSFDENEGTKRAHLNIDLKALDFTKIFYETKTTNEGVDYQEIVGVELNDGTPVINGGKIEDRDFREYFVRVQEKFYFSNSAKEKLDKYCGYLEAQVTAPLTAVSLEDFLPEKYAGQIDIVIDFDFETHYGLYKTFFDDFYVTAIDSLAQTQVSIYNTDFSAALFDYIQSKAFTVE